MIGRMVLGATVVAATLVAAGAAQAGGFSTVELHSLPKGLEPGEAWDARFSVLAHGRMPIEGLRPSVRIERVGGDGKHAIAATETGRAGTYRAEVTFPAAGRWQIEVAEHPDIEGSPVAGHRFGAVQIGDRAQTTAGAPGWPLPLAAAVALAAGLLAGGAAWLLQPRPAPRTPPTTP